MVEQEFGIGIVVQAGNLLRLLGSDWTCEGTESVGYLYRHQGGLSTILTGPILVMLSESQDLTMRSVNALLDAVEDGIKSTVSLKIEFGANPQLVAVVK